jgi:hypothetical protein
VSAVGRDINLHGLFLCTDEIVEPGSLMRLSVTLPERTIELFVTARFVGRSLSGQGIGVEIFAIDGESQAHWTSFYRGLAHTHRIDTGAAAETVPPASR